MNWIYSYEYTGNLREENDGQGIGFFPGIGIVVFFREIHLEVPGALTQLTLVSFEF